MIDILSYPRSGNHLVRYLVEYLSGHATRGCAGNEQVDTKICQRPNVAYLAHVDPDCVLALKYHFSCHISDPSDRLIFVLRNPVECLYSHNVNDKSGAAISHQLQLYMNNIKYFHAHSAAKLILYYEELVYYNTAASVSMLHSFLGEDSSNERYSELMANLQLFLDDATRSLLRAPQSFSPCHYGNLGAHS